MNAILNRNNPAGVMLENGNEIFNNYNENVSQGKYAHAEGSKTIAGLMGYYYHDIRFNSEELTFYLTKIQGTVPAESISIPYNIGDVVSVVNGSKYPNVAHIVYIGDNYITVSCLDTTTGDINIPFDKMVEMDPSEYAMDDFSIWVEAKPTEGEVPLGYYAHAEGEKTQALERASHAEGRETFAQGQYAHAEGRKTKAAYASHSEGLNSEASGFYAHAQNRDTVASGNDSSAEGLKTKAIGQASHAQNVSTEAEGYASTACGTLTKAIGKHSFSTGNQTVAMGDNSFTAGVATHADANNSFAIGYYTVAGSPHQSVRGRFNEIDTEGKYIDIVGNGGGEDTRSNAYTLTEDGDGWFKKSVTTTDIKVNNLLKAGAVQANTSQSVGLTTTTANVNKDLTVAGKTTSNEYTGNTIKLAGSMVIGHNSSAHQSCVSVGSYCHAGNSDGDIRYAVALGYNNNALFGGSSAIGQGLTTGRASQHVIGEYNQVKSDALFVIGNGDDINHKSNAATIDKSGNAWIAGNAECNALIMSSPDGSRWKITVTNEGNLTTTKL